MGLHNRRLMVRMAASPDPAHAGHGLATYFLVCSGILMSTFDTSERRAYYRIQDRIALQISADQAQAQEESVLFALLNELYTLELEAQPLLRSISEQQRTLVSYLKITNKRIDLLAHALAQSLLSDMGEPQQVTLSEGGISFISPDVCNEGSSLYLKAILLPQAFGIQLKAHVIRCRPSSQGGYRVAARFQELSEAQRQVLARHIMHRQAQERREALAQGEGDTP